MTPGEIRAYAAGLIDGEGCIGAYNTRPKMDRRAAYYQLTVRVTMKAAEPILFLHRHFVGALTISRKKSGDGRAYSVWHARNRKAEAFLLEILPYLIEKRAQAELALEFAALRRRTRAGFKSGQRYPDNVLNIYDGYVKRLKAMKRSAQEV